MELVTLASIQRSNKHITGLRSLMRIYKHAESAMLSSDKRAPRKTQQKDGPLRPCLSLPVAAEPLHLTGSVPEGSVCLGISLRCSMYS